ncbi:hypothetical protein BP6252_14071 [Coleophoma cylindrospora]|uniref:Fe2OG dioxygenase domain-containing protein n=1 Tax=Coleophoma cylindrospora TaxID=1849047 RepID=A0A3D8Q4U8_9HELO|nr:hypothetical protein BP6252_14071 [Coleophoma cylindrospora]
MPVTTIEQCEALILPPEFTEIRLTTAQGPVYRQVSTAAPRDAVAEEVPVIDISRINDDLEIRKELAREVAETCSRYGFFYIRNHGIPEDKINAAKEQAFNFFRQPKELKEKVSQQHSKYSNGWSSLRSRRVSPTESADKKEGFIWSYDPEYDPDTKDVDQVPAPVANALHAEKFIWDGTSHLPDFRDAILSYWQECVTLSRKLVRTFALALDLPESYFDDLVTYPGSDGAINFYPGVEPGSNPGATLDVGLGSHTDLQCFTLLWQDEVGGLQLLSQSGQWLKVPPISGTLVVNIGDFLMRLTNDRFISTVHRVYNYSIVDRLSMPFFFGFNFNENVEVLPSCIDETHPAKYEPISCGAWCKRRLAMVKL